MKYSRIGIIKFHQKKLKLFDEITQFRLIMSAVMAILFSLVLPILSQYMNLLNVLVFSAATVIAAFGIVKTIGLKLVTKINDNFSFSNIFLIVIIVDILYALVVLLFFYDKKIMIFAEMTLSIIHMPFLSAYSNALNNYINYFESDSYSKFQNYRNDLIAESHFFGLILSLILTFISAKLAVIVFSIGMMMISIYQLKMLHIFKKFDFRYMYIYKHKTKKK